MLKHKFLPPVFRRMWKGNVFTGVSVNGGGEGGGAALPVKHCNITHNAMGQGVAPSPGPGWDGGGGVSPGPGLGWRGTPGPVSGAVWGRFPSIMHCNITHNAMGQGGYPQSRSRLGEGLPPVSRLAVP